MRILALSLLIACLAGCNDSGPLRPPELALGHDICAVCGMSVSDDRYAAAVVLRHDARVTTLLLDDLGELRKLTLPEHDAIAIFVCDEATRSWVRAEDAHYVKSETLRTPMGFGIAAMASAERARVRSGELSGQVVTYAEIAPRR